jgi:thiol-disulfide isomerase/thioredoxin
MRSLILISLVCTFAAAAFEIPNSLMPEGGDIEWRMVGQRTHVFRDGLLEAKERNKPVLVFFTCGCDTCHTLWVEHFSDPDAVELSEKFIPLFVKGNQELVREYDVAGCPYVVFIAPDGEIIRDYKEDKLLEMDGPGFAKRMKRILKLIQD